jgi:hypothetical protein
LARDIDIEIREGKNRLQRFKTEGVLSPTNKQDIADTELEIRQLEQRKRHIQRQRLSGSKLDTSSEGGQKEFEELFK